MIPLDRSKNFLLSALPEHDWQAMASGYHPVTLSSGQILYEAGQSYDRFYFPTAGVVSTVAVFRDGTNVEMAATGREGMVGIASLLGSETALNRIIVQVPGTALAIGPAAFADARKSVPPLEPLLLQYAQAYLAQALQSAACNAAHSVQERACRWLLMCHDRVAAEVFPITQEYLAALLGVSRAAVNMVARMLQRSGFIRYRRGAVTILDRTALERASCECYAIIRGHYEKRLFAKAPGP